MEELESMEEEGLLPDDAEPLPMFAAARPGCTPFEFINFTDESVEHDIAITVRHPADVLKSCQECAEHLRGAVCRLHVTPQATTQPNSHMQNIPACLPSSPKDTRLLELPGQ